MPCQNYLLDAIDLVLAWDLPDEAIGEAVKDQANLMARVNPEEMREFCSD